MLLVLLVHPDLDHPLVVDGDDGPLHLVCQGSEAVRHEGSVDVADPGAGNPHDGSSALPDLEAQLEVFSAPDEKAGVVGAEGEEVLPVDGEETPGVSW